MAASTAPTPPPSRFLVRLDADRWRAVDLSDVYFVEAAGRLEALRGRFR